MLELKKVKKTITILAVCAVLYIAAHFAWDYYYPSGTWRYKITVTVETPEGLKAGSAVREVYAYREPQVLGVTTGGHTHLKRGEAVVVDLGKRGTLFALLRGGLRGEDYGWAIVYHAFPFSDSTGETTKEIILHYRDLKNAKAVLTPAQYPMFVHFKDITDPKTVEGVSPINEKDMSDQYGGIARTTENIFGTGVKLKEVTLEMTEEPITREIDKYLLWFQKVKMSYLNGKHSARGAPLELHGGNFQQGVK
jgi:hypothetical protein